MKRLVNEKLALKIEKRRECEKRKYKRQKEKVKRKIYLQCIKCIEKNFIMYFHEFHISRERLLKILKDLAEEQEICYKIGSIDNLEYINIDLTSQFACINNSQPGCELGKQTVK